MRLHVTAVERLIRLYESYGGHRNQEKLKGALAEVDLAEYTRQNGEKILVLAEDMQREQAKSD